VLGGVGHRPRCGRRACAPRERHGSIAKTRSISATGQQAVILPAKNRVGPIHHVFWPSMFVRSLGGRPPRIGDPLQRPTHLFADHPKI